jgi:hypothetical protein
VLQLWFSFSVIIIISTSNKTQSFICMHVWSKYSHKTWDVIISLSYFILFWTKHFLHKNQYDLISWLFIFVFSLLLSQNFCQVHTLSLLWNVQGYGSRISWRKKYLFRGHFVSCTSSVEDVGNSLRETEDKTMFIIESDLTKDSSQHSFLSNRKWNFTFIGKTIFQIISSIKSCNRLKTHPPTTDHDE